VARAATSAIFSLTGRPVKQGAADVSLEKKSANIEKYFRKLEYYVLVA
jgi:hypothetical protein